MAGSPQTDLQHLRASHFIKSFKLSGAAGAILAMGSSWQSLHNIRRALVNVNNIVATAGISLVEILVDDTSNGGSGSLIVLKSMTLAGPLMDAVNDQVNLEFTEDEVAEVGVKDYSLGTPADRATPRFPTHFNVRVTTNNLADVANVAIFCELKHKQSDKTPAQVIA